MALALTRGKWPAGSLILSHQEPESLIGLSSMSQSVALFSSIAAYSQYLLVREQLERKQVNIRWWWESSPCLSPTFKYLTPTSCFLDTPELVASATSDASSASASSTRAQSPTSTDASSSSPTSSSITSSIVGIVVGGVVVILIGVIVIGLLWRRRRPQAPAPVATSMAPPVIGTFQRPMEEIQQPLTMDDAYAASSIPGTIGSSMPGTPLTPASAATPMRLYVRVFVPS